VMSRWAHAAAGRMNVASKNDAARNQRFMRAPLENNKQRRTDRLRASPD
jgi:hypothetical protein